MSENVGDLVVVTGMTGAGRSTAAKELEDLGFYVVDNLPPQLVPDVVRLVDETQGRLQPIAVVVDVRSGSFFGSLQEVLAQGTTGRRTTLLFLEANDDVLVRRQEAARRPHPLQEGGRLLDGLQRERKALASLRGDADVVIDTSNLNVHELRERLSKVFADEHGGSGLNVSITSFGFKHGAPRDADMVLDVRFLANPHWEPQLRPLTGQDHAVSDYVLSSADAGEFLERTVGLINFLLPRYRAEGKSYVSIGIGCTGGRHRSVAIAEYLGKQLGEDVDVIVQHRDI